jgi:hypothetical protein
MGAVCCAKTAAATSASAQSANAREVRLAIRAAFLHKLFMLSTKLTDSGSGDLLRRAEEIEHQFHPFLRRS